MFSESFYFPDRIVFLKKISSNQLKMIPVLKEFIIYGFVRLSCGIWGNLWKICSSRVKIKVTACLCIRKG